MHMFYTKVILKRRLWPAANCPFLSKSIDFYVRKLSLSKWSAAQPDTQFLGANKSHELGAILLTECITHAKKDLNQPIFCLFLDARSAFDLTIREIMTRKLYLCGTTGQNLLYLDNRMKSRKKHLLSGTKKCSVQFLTSVVWSKAAFLLVTSTLSIMQTSLLLLRMLDLE